MRRMVMLRCRVGVRRMTRRAVRAIRAGSVIVKVRPGVVVIRRV